MPVTPRAKAAMSGIAVLAIGRNGGIAASIRPAAAAWRSKPRRKASRTISRTATQASRICQQVSHPFGAPGQHHRRQQVSHEGLRG